MSVISVAPSPRYWHQQSPRRKPPATPTVPPATGAATAATLTALYSDSRSAINNNNNNTTTTNNPDPNNSTRQDGGNGCRSSKPFVKTFLLEPGISDVGNFNNNNNNNNNVRGGDGGGIMDGGGVAGGGGGVSKISFAPGTTFNDRTRLRSRGSSRRVTIPDAINIRPGTSEEPQRRFKLPKATLPSLHYLSVSQEDFLDPRYAEDIVKTYGIPRYFFKSKSSLLTNSAPGAVKSRRKPTAATTNSNSAKTTTGAAFCSGNGNADSGGGTVAQTGHSQKASEDGKRRVGGREAAAEWMETEAEAARPLTSEYAVPRLSNRLPIVVPIATTSPDQRSPSTHPQGYNYNGSSGAEGADGGNGSGSNSLPQVVPLYKPLIGEKYTQARFCPPMNPFRSLQMESEVTKYVDHKKRVGLGKYVRLAETDSKPSSALAREASMYDLNNQGPAERPLDQYLPPPDRKPFLLHRPREPRTDVVRNSDDHDLVIMPRERTATEKSSVILKEMLR